MKKPIITQNRVLAGTVIATGLVLAAGAFVLWPAYTNPESRFYTSAIGFLKVQRLLGMPMEAEAEHPVWHDFETPVLGEGTLQCNFYNVPVVPVARITALHVEEGDQVTEGQLLAELDDTTAALNLRSAQLALGNATAERERVNAGSVNTMVAERPTASQVSIEGLKKVATDAEAKVAIVQRLARGGASSRLDLVNAEMDLATAEMNYNQAKVDAGMSTAGFPQSKEIAQNAVDDAQNLVKQRQEELKYYQVTAPATGTIDRVLVRNGEYNQTAGNPGFIIASGLWFEANLDQRALANVHEGMDATVNLEAYAGRDFQAKVDRIVPIVTFDAGGPETKTPVRPLGTGSPEWPATFTVRLRLIDPGVRIAPGMTGFARVVAHHRRALSVPREAISSLSEGKGVVRIVADSGHPVTTPVSLGAVDERFVEITGGVDASDWVLTSSPRFLRDDDKIHITRIMASEEY
jgi:HlyD family secretion protein